MSREVQQVKKQHPVPQNIMSVEFKLIGDMTVRQFFYVASGAILGILFFKSGLPFFVKWAFTLFFGLGGAAMAFVPLQERGLDVWFKSFIRMLGVPTQMVWKKDPAPPIFFLSDYAKSVTSDVIAMTPTKSRHRLYSYLETVRSGANLDSHDQKEREMLSKLNFNVLVPPQLALAFTEVTGVPQSQFLDTISSLPLLLPAGSASFGEDLFTNQTVPLIKNIKKDRPLRNIVFEKEIILPSQEKKEKLAKIEVIVTPKSQDETNLLQKKTEDLKKTIGKIRKHEEKEDAEEALKNLPKEPKAKKEGVSKFTKFVTIFLRSKAGVAKKSSKTELSSEPLGSQKSDDSLFTKISKQAEEQKEKTKETATIVSEAEIKEPKPAPQISKIEIVNVAHKTSPLDINVLKGRVLDNADRIVEGALLLIKDATGDPERATKTNALGEFITVTPLTNGKYSIETKYEGLVFDVVNFIATGAKLDYLTIKASKTNG